MVIIYTTQIAQAYGSTKQQMYMYKFEVHNFHRLTNFRIFMVLMWGSLVSFKATYRALSQLLLFNFIQQCNCKIPEKLLLLKICPYYYGITYLTIEQCISYTSKVCRERPCMIQNYSWHYFEVADVNSAHIRSSNLVQ